MVETTEFGRVCRVCGNKNSGEAKRCASCSADLDPVEEPAIKGFVDDDPALRYVDANNRIEVERFERWDEAELAAGCCVPTAFPAS
jgi:hypothetical protein